MTCKFCRGRMHDLTNDKGAGRNYFCTSCRAHYYHPMKSYLANRFYDAKWFTWSEWKVFVNKETV